MIGTIKRNNHMKKILAFLDTHVLKFGVAFAIVFTALYPKLPSINIDYTWVYIRLEDFLILALAIIWFVQLLRKKVSLPRPEGYAIILYWFVGLISLLYAITILAPTLANFFPSVAWLQYFRRIEYMILFFIAFSTIKHKKDLYFYLITLCITVFGVVFYGFGQKFYLFVWNLAPEIFKGSTFCFPAFLTGNEEFAKGFPLCLSETSRITSTFGGHYDLAAYLVMVLPILIALAFGVRQVKYKVLLAILAIFALELLNFTSSRTSFGAYVVSIIGMFMIWNKKRWIVPILALSLCVMFLFTSSTIDRFAKTIQPVQVVSIPEGTSEQDLQEAIAKVKEKESIKTPETPQPGTVTVGQTTSETDLEEINTQVLTQNDIEALKDANLPISTQSGAFLMKKAYALDISFTTRFEAEWPRNWAAFLSSPLLGTGYSSLTLATDNDYLRALGETGLLGLLSFLLIFTILGILMKKTEPDVKDSVEKAYLFGLAGGVIGLLMNAVLIDVFEASKVAEPLWLLLGLGAGTAKLYQKHTIHYAKELYTIFTSKIMFIIYIFILIATTFIASTTNFFVGDDFTWLYWAAIAQPSDLLNYFVNAENFFYRPLDKIVVYGLYQVFSFQPQGYHLFTIFVHFIATSGVFLLATAMTKRKLLGASTAILFALHPAFTENIYWFSTLSMQLSSSFILYALVAFVSFRKKATWWKYALILILSTLALFSHEIAIIIPVLYFMIDISLYKVKPKTALYSYLPVIGLVLGYFVLRAYAQSFAGGGAYSYDLINLIPNVIGNYLGYLGLFFVGTGFVGLYETIRESMRSHWIATTLVLAMLLSFALWSTLSMRKHLHALFKHEHIRFIIFGLVFAFVSLLPFLPLGNIATRYVYLASFGYTLSFVVLVYMFLHSNIRKKIFVSSVLLVIVVSIGSVSYTQQLVEAKKWETSGKITKETLLFFRRNYASFTPETQIFIVDTPVKQNGVWVLPVGLKDGIWFIYRANTPQIEQVGSIAEAKQKASQSVSDDVFIFQFDGNGRITEVKE